MLPVHVASMHLEGPVLQGLESSRQCYHGCFYVSELRSAWVVAVNRALRRLVLLAALCKECSSSCALWIDRCEICTGVAHAASSLQTLCWKNLCWKNRAD